MQDLVEIELRAVQILEHYEECYTHFKKGNIVLNLIKQWRDAFCNGTVNINETMNFCREAEMVKNDYDLLFHGFYNSNTEINHKLWEEFLTQRFDRE